MAKRKSYRDIEDQVRRIQYALGYDNPRSRRAREIGERYKANIRKSNPWYRDVEDFEERAGDEYSRGYENAGRVRVTRSGDYWHEEEREFEANPAAFPRLYDRRFKHQYTRAVYQQGQKDDVKSAKFLSKFGNVRTTTTSAQGLVTG